MEISSQFLAQLFCLATNAPLFELVNAHVIDVVSLNDSKVGRCFLYQSVVGNARRSFSDPKVLGVATQSVLQANMIIFLG